MRNRFWATTHPAWTVNGYKCLCGKIFNGMNDLFIHVVCEHDEQTATQILSYKQLEKYIKCTSLCNGYKLSYNGYRISKFGGLGYYEAKKKGQGFIGESIKELINNIDNFLNQNNVVES